MRARARVCVCVCVCIPMYGCIDTHSKVGDRSRG